MAITSGNKVDLAAREQAKKVLDGRYLIRCPVWSFQLRLAMACANCQHFMGVKMGPDRRDPEKAVKVVCGHPVNRKLVKIGGFENGSPQ